MDNDPIVLLHAQALLTSSPEGAVAYLDADLRDPEKILGEAVKAPDFGQPMAIKWRPRSEAESAEAAALWGGVARKPA